MIITVLASNCKSSPSAKSQEPHIIIASILPLAEFAGKIVGEKMDVFEMVPPGASPHTYEPSPGQLEKVSKAEIYLAVGSGIEFEIVWLDKIIGINDDMMLVDCSRGVELIKIAEKADPHIWLSPKNAAAMVENIYLGLSAIYPDNKDYFYDNMKDYLDELEMLDGRIKEILEDRTQHKILVFHPGWSYFARDYGLEEIIVEKEGKEPSPKDMIELIDQAKESNIKVIFASPEFSLKSAEVIADEIGGKVVLVSPLAGDYMKNLMKITAAFKESMD